MKYIIEIPGDVQYVLLNGKADNKYYTAVRPIAELEELNSDYINEHFGELQDEAYQAGLNDMWDVVRKISLMTSAEAEEVFAGAGSYNRYNLGYSGVEAMDAYKAYLEKKDCIEVGDEVKHHFQGYGVVTRIKEVNGKTHYNAVWSNGNTGYYESDDLTKTGKHYDIQSILEAMRTHD